jgi:4'-phosphopantetheinyl transferase EntD
MESSVHIFNNVFLSILEVDEIVKTIPQKIINQNSLIPKRFVEKEGIKYLMKNYLPEKTLIYNDNGKPLIQEGGYLSISHSKSLIGLAWSSELNIGLDIEEISSKIERIENRFVHASEKKIAHTQEEKTIIWCIKESMVKILDDKSINFKEDLRVIKNSSPNVWGCYVQDEMSKLYLFSTFKLKNNIVCIHTKLEASE